MIRALTIAGALGVLLAACRAETIVLATVPDADDAGTGHPPVKCFTNADCGDSGSDFCDLDPSNSAKGHCRPRPPLCDDDVHPVCGGSGITYLNECYRRQALESSQTEGICENDVARFCDPTHLCPLGATCALLGGGAPGALTCGPPSGHCWGIASCPDDDDEDHFRWDQCSTEGGALRCVSTCTAIQSGRVFARAAFDCRP